LIEVGGIAILLCQRFHRQIGVPCLPECRKPLRLAGVENARARVAQVAVQTVVLAEVVAGRVARVRDGADRPVQARVEIAICIAAVLTVGRAIGIGRIALGAATKES